MPDLVARQLLFLPDGLGALGASLQRLLLGRNRLTALPASLGRLSRLTQLQVNWNQLAALPEELGGCGELRELQLSTNRVAALPASFSRLTMLCTCALQDNAFLLLPALLGHMPHLTRLAHTGNPWLMPQQEVLAWPPNCPPPPATARLAVGMPVWARFQRLPRFRRRKDRVGLVEDWHASSACLASAGLRFPPLALLSRCCRA